MGTGLEDIFIGGGAGQAGAIFIQSQNGTFSRSRQPAFMQAMAMEDVDALFFDSNGDGAHDLYVVSGGYGDYEPEDPLLQDRLYLNDGTGTFETATSALPQMQTSTSAVASLDVNEDGAPDLIVGGYVVPGRYPESPRSYVLINDGTGSFLDGTMEHAAELHAAGMVTDVEAVDLNGDNKKELILTGEWLPVKVFQVIDRKLVDSTTSYLEGNYSGFWNTLHVHDFNQDGMMDILAGNLGLNTQINATSQEPAELFYGDFNNDGVVDPLLQYYVQGIRHPFPTLEALSKQLPVFARQFPDHRSYGMAGIEDIIPQELLNEAIRLEAEVLETSLFLSGANGKYTRKALPVETQFAPVFSFLVTDVDGDGESDILLGGNVANGSVRLGKYDTGRGALLRGNGEGGFEYVSPLISGLNLEGEIRKIIMLGDYFLVARRGMPLDAFYLTGD